MLTNNFHISKIYVSGSNTQGQTGLSLSEKQFVIPRPCHFGVMILQISCGYYHTLMLVKGGLVYQTGNQNQQPTVLPLKNIIQIAAGGWHNIAQTNDYQLYSWGRGDDGQLCLIAPQQSLQLPQLIQIERKPYQFSLGGYHTMIWNDLEILSCGKGTFGQLGHGNSNSLSTLTHVDMKSIRKINCGDQHTLFLDNKNQVWICGVVGQTFAMTPIAMKIPKNIEVVDICAGRKDSAIIGSQGELYIMDEKSHLFINITTCKIKMKSDSYIIQDTEGNLFSWGKNNYGELGHGDIQDRAEPSYIDQMDLILDFDLGETHAIFLSSKPLLTQVSDSPITVQDEENNKSEITQSTIIKKSPRCREKSYQSDLYKECLHFDRSNTFKLERSSQPSMLEKENTNPQETYSSNIKVSTTESLYSPEVSQYRQSIQSILKDKKIAELQLELSSKDEIINQLQFQMNTMEKKYAQSQNIISSLKKNISTKYSS